MDGLEHMRMTYESLRQITAGFSTEIGRVPNAVVYKGRGPDAQQLAVMVLRPFERLDNDRLDLHRFLECVALVAKAKHPNLMQLLGYCHEKKGSLSFEKVYMALCFEYTHNASLMKHIHDDEDRHGLGWHQRYRIVKGICEGLKHLHKVLEVPILHLNLKPANILLDEKMVPKIADFGLYSANEDDTAFSFAGSFEYAPPEYIITGRISDKADIFSLGLIIMEIMVGRKGCYLHRQMAPDSFSEQVCNKWRTRMQTNIHGHTTLDADYRQVEKCIEIALRCILEDDSKRPAIEEIVEQLNQIEGPFRSLPKELVVQTYKEQHTETVHEDSGYDDLNILESIVNGSKEPGPLDLALLQRITENFSETKKIGRGGCAIVYKGILPSGAIAVKKLLNTRTIKGKMFHRELRSLISVKHQNIVRFLGYCSFTEEHALQLQGRIIMVDIRERLLCFEYIRNGSLDNHLTDELRGLEWQTRYQIIIGICRGLQYLHKDKGIIHMDLKPGNILLDDLMVPKITDFGLSRLESDSQATTTRLMSQGYAAPEYSSGGKATTKSDIYSLGVVIIELVTGSKTKPNIPKVLKKWNHRWIKPMKQSSLGYHRWIESMKKLSMGYQQVSKCLELALRCKQDAPTDRPSIEDIVDELDKIDTTYGQTQTQISLYCLEDILEVSPLEIRIPFEDFKISHSIELTNDTDDYIAFLTKAKLGRFCTEPDKGIVPPGSKRSVTLAMQMQGQVNTVTVPSKHYIEVITVLSTRVDGALAVAAMDVTTRDIFFDKEGEVVADEVNVMVVFGRPQLPEE